MCLRCPRLTTHEAAGDRTQDLRIKSPLLYQLSYRLGWAKDSDARYVLRAIAVDNQNPNQEIRSCACG